MFPFSACSRENPMPPLAAFRVELGGHVLGRNQAVPATAAAPPPNQDLPAPRRDGNFQARHPADVSAKAPAAFTITEALISAAIG